jgi:hypothetical protein
MTLEVALSPTSPKELALCEMKILASMLSASSIIIVKFSMTYAIVASYISHKLVTNRLLVKLAPLVPIDLS